MVWPTALTDDQDIKDIVWLENLDNMKKASVSYDGLHEAASQDVRQMYQVKFGNPDLEANPEAFKRVAAFIFASTLFEQRDSKVSGKYYARALSAFKAIESERASNEDSKDSGPNAEVYLSNPGGSPFYNRQDQNGLFYGNPGVGPGRPW